MTRDLSKSADGRAAYGLDAWTEQERLALLACYDVWSATPGRACDIVGGENPTGSLVVTRG